MRSTEWRPRHAAWQSKSHGGAAIGELNLSPFTMSRIIPTFAVIAIVVLTGCSRSVSMKIARDGKEPVFHFQTRGMGMGGVTGLRIWRMDTKEVLWHVSLPCYSERRLGYGEVPTEIQASTGNRASQSFPRGASSSAKVLWAWSGLGFWS